MANNKKTETKTPFGLTLIRDNNKFVFGWKTPSTKYRAGLQLQYRVTNGSWTSMTVSGLTDVTSKTLTLSTSDWRPTTDATLMKVFFRIRGKREEYDVESTHFIPGWSEWARKEFEILVPNIPNVEANLSSEYSNVTTFSWATNVNTTDSRWFTNCEYQTMLLPECTETDGSKLKWTSTKPGWATNTGGASSSATYTEDTTTIATGSHTRWFRVRARGPRGNSAWDYAKHVYAKPKAATITEVAGKALDNGGTYARVVWVATQNAAYPIDSTTVQYVITTPAAGMTCPNNANWQTANTSRDTSGSDAAVFTIGTQIGLDQALFVRVGTTHDGTTTYTPAKLVRKGKLTNPTNLSVTPNSSTYKATVAATNGSTVPDSFLAVYYRRASAPGKDLCVGIIPHGDSSVTVQCPDWSGESAVAFGVRATVGSYTAMTRADGVDSYAVTVLMNSDTLWDGGQVPKAPSTVNVATTDLEGTVRVKWAWSWSAATSAEISWADHEDAWESTDGPKSYSVSNLYASEWNIAGLATGKMWYFRVRLIAGKTIGPWSDIKSINLSTAPATPALELSDGVINTNGQVTCYWGYSSTDNTNQIYAEVCQATIAAGVITYGSILAHVKTAKQVTIKAAKVGWTAGNTYNLCVRVKSASGRESAWSDPVPVTVADTITATITSTNFTSKTLTDQDGNDRTAVSLTSTPLRATVTGAGTGGTTTLVIERAEDYQMDRPDETHFNGFEGETIAVKRRNGEAEIAINRSELIGVLDDGAKYRLIATVQDGFGQSAEAVQEFEVHWAHQAGIPTATVVYDGSIAKITATAPTGATSADKVDIYRLSADRPELVVDHGDFGTTYVDPYPAIGEEGGYRCVCVTANGDYVTADETPAWVDKNGGLAVDYTIIDFDSNQVFLPYNLELSNTWTKSFIETQYLGGAVQGDWNPAISRTASVSSTSVVLTDAETIRQVRRLADYSGICHIRTVEGSSFDADIQVTETRSHTSGGRIAEFTFTITRVDAEGLAGVTLAMWEEQSESTGTSS